MAFIDLTASTDSELECSDSEVVCLGVSGNVAVKNEGPSGVTDERLTSIRDWTEDLDPLSSEDGEEMSTYDSEDEPLSDTSATECGGSCDFYNEDPTLPVYQWTKPNHHYSVEELAKLLIANPVPKEKVCSKQPMRVCRNVAFVVNLHALDDPLDIRADENGVWKRKGSPVTYVSIHTHSGKTNVYKRSRMGNHPHHYKVTRTYYRHTSSPDFNRIITTVHDNQGQCQQLAFVQYGFDRQEHPIEIKPHGNSKGKKPFSRCKPSTLKLLKSAVETKPPLQALRDVENVRGGVMSARSGCELPRNRKQVYNFKSAMNNQGEGVASGAAKTIPHTDVLAQVMLMCKESSGSQAYVRSVEAAPEPMCVLTTDQQLADLERFCTSDPFGVVCVDPTFNLGPFYVTPITYQNLLVKTEKGSHPIVLGPVLIHQTKTFRPFHYFASTLVRLNPRLTKLQAFGTDGEPELIKAFSVAFPRAVHLRCINHMRQNVKDKLHALHIPKSIWKEFLADIFGVQTGSHFEMGLIDAQSDESFWKALKRLRERWNNLEMGCIVPGTDPQFHGWFCDYKANDIVECVLPKVRAKAGIKEPCRKFTINTSESLNHVIKQEVDWKENKLPVVIKHLKSITDRYSAELEKAVIGRGQWHFTSQYQHLQVPEVSWFQRAPLSKERHMNKVLNCAVTTSHSYEKQATVLSTASSSAVLRGSGESKLATSTADPQGNSENTPQTVLEVAVEDCGITTISMPILKNMWNKAERLVCSGGGILKVPWSSDKKARLVRSSSSDHPHLITTRCGKKTQYICDDKCTMFKGFSLCSHVIAAAHDNGDLHSFLEYHNQRKCGPNLTAIASQGMPSGSGRKGGVPKRKQSRVTVPVETRSVRQCLKNPIGECSSSSPTSSFTADSLNPSVLTTASSTPSLDHLYTVASAFGPRPPGPSSTFTASNLLQTHPTTATTTSTFQLKHGTHCQAPSSSTVGGQRQTHPFLTFNLDQTADTLLPNLCTSALGCSRVPLTPANSFVDGAASVIASAAPIYQTNTSSVGLVLGANINITTSPSTPVVSSHPTTTSTTTTTQPSYPGGALNLTPSISCGSGRAKEQFGTNPFILKFKTRQIKVCQACRKDYEGVNDTMGLVVARAERRMVSNLTTGTQFIGRESNSHG